jgi:transcription elongation GreA/GreB family factor|nr:MAG TPA: transcription elongation factor GreA [Caudoviricetes sp.]
MSGKPHKGSWGDRYIIEPRPNQKRITCNFCKNYNKDGSCNVQPIVISEVGYDYWKYCKSFYLSEDHSTSQNRGYVARNKKVRSTYVKEVAATVEDRPTSPWMTKYTKQPKTIKLGSKVWVYDESYDEEVLYELVRPTEADVLNGKISISSPVAQGLLGAKEGDRCSIEAPSGIIKYKVLRIK